MLVCHVEHLKDPICHGSNVTFSDKQFSQTEQTSPSLFSNAEKNNNILNIASKLNVWS